jgi:DNA-binding NtrC family response regulator
MLGFYEITRTTPEDLADRLGYLFLRPPQCVNDRLPSDYHGTVTAFKRDLLERVLQAYGGNRTHAARALGLQRTYLLRLIRDLDIAVPPPARKPRPQDSG